MTAACTDEALSREKKSVKSPSTSSEFPNRSAISQSNISNSKLEQSELTVVNEENAQKMSEAKSEKKKSTEALEVYLESRGICAWEENDDTCHDELESSSESLEIPEFLSEMNNTSSGYNSSGNEGKIESKRDSASSISDSGDSSLSTTKTQENADVFCLQKLEVCLSNFKTNLESVNGAERVDKNVYDPEDGEKFHRAIRNGNVSEVAALVENRLIQDLDEPDWNFSGDPPLLVAATNHCLPILSLLLSNGCDPGSRSPRGETALHRAIINGGPGQSLEFVRELLKYGCSAGVKEAGGGLTALHILTRQLAHTQTSRGLVLNDFENALETLSSLAKAGAVNDKDHQGRSALHILASSTALDSNHRTEIGSLIKILLDAGADPTLKNDRGETPLHEALESGALNTADLLIPHTPACLTSRYGESPLHIAAKKNHTEAVEKLLKRGENPSTQDAEGNTPLHLASGRGFYQVVSLLLTSPLIDLEQTNDEGLTALQVAAESGFANTVRMLIRAGADPWLIGDSTSMIQHRHPDISTLINDEITRRVNCKLRVGGEKWSGGALFRVIGPRGFDSGVSFDASDCTLISDDTAIYSEFL